MMVINYFCGMVDQRKAFGLNSSWDHCQGSSQTRISDTPRAGFELAQSLSSGLVEWSCAVVITTTPRRHLPSIFPFFMTMKKERIRSKIFLLHFYDAHDGNLWEKNFGRTTSYSCRTNVFIEFHRFMKKG